MELRDLQLDSGEDVEVHVGMMPYDGTFQASWGYIVGDPGTTEEEALSNLLMAIRDTQARLEGR